MLLSPRAVGILREMAAVRTSPYVFPGVGGGRPLSNMALLTLLKRMNWGARKWLDEDGRPITAHGFRSTFRTWAEEVATTPHAIVEHAMGHKVGSKVERAYNRSDLLDKRRDLMSAWAGYIAATPGANVLDLKGGRAVCEGGREMIAKHGREASDQAAWRQRGKALARVLESVENHKVDWRGSQSFRKALEEVNSLPHPDVELYLGVEIAAGWLAHLVREFALDENATLSQMQLVIGTARAIVENGGLALAAQKIIGSREVYITTKQFGDALLAGKKAREKQTKLASQVRREKKTFLDELVPALGKEQWAKPGKSKSTPQRIAEEIFESVNMKLSEAGIKGGAGVDAIAGRLRAIPTDERY